MKEINTSEFEDLIKEELSFVYVTAIWCGPCKAFSPIVSEVSEVYKNKVNFGKLDADANSGKLEELQIKGIPTILIFKNGVEVDRTSGLKSKQNLISMIESHLTEFSSEEDF